jgi:phosphoribosylaminoimidazole (AIR) synthetase
MNIIELFVACAILVVIFLLGYLARGKLEPTVFKRIISGPIQGGSLDGRYVVEGFDGNIHYAHPPFTLTLD